jgi:UDP-N-acetylglucosamine acyltransferase
MSIHPSAIVDPGARIAPGAVIGPYCVIGDGVVIGERTRLIGNVFVEGMAVIGEDNVVYPYTTIGMASQDKKYHGERSETRIGNRNTIREFVTIHRGTEGGGLMTAIGDDNWIMSHVHLAHDVLVGNQTILSHGVVIGGHVQIGDWAVLGGGSAVHQFCRIGRHSMVGGYSVITQDVLPFSMTVSPRENKVFGANSVGLERRGFEAGTIEHLQRFFRILTRGGLNTTQAIEKIRSEMTDQTCPPELDEVLAFIASSERGFVK